MMTKYQIYYWYVGCMYIVYNMALAAAFLCINVSELVLRVFLFRTSHDADVYARAFAEFRVKMGVMVNREFNRAFVGLQCYSPDAHRALVSTGNARQLFASNHQTSLDQMFCAWCMSCPVTTVVKSSLRYIPVMGYTMAQAMMFFKDRNRSVDFVAKISAFLKTHDVAFMVYPEGTRSDTHTDLQKIHDGVFHIAHTSCRDVVPVFHNTAHIISEKKKEFYPHMKGRVGFVLGTPISHKLSVDDMREAYIAQMATLKSELDRVSAT